MSFYRSVIVAVAAMGLATSVFAADETSNPAQNSAEATPAAIQTADATPAAQPEAAMGMEQKVNMNTATAKELMKVKGLNAAKAKAIVSFRKKHGDFKSVEDLKEVKGFSKMHEKTMKEVQEQLTVG